MSKLKSITVREFMVSEFERRFLAAISSKSSMRSKEFDAEQKEPLKCLFDCVRYAFLNKEIFKSKMLGKVLSLAKEGRVKNLEPVECLFGLHNEPSEELAKVVVLWAIELSKVTVGVGFYGLWNKLNKGPDVLKLELFNKTPLLNIVKKMIPYISAESIATTGQELLAGIEESFPDIRKDISFSGDTLQYSMKQHFLSGAFLKTTIIESAPPIEPTNELKISLCLLIVDKLHDIDEDQMFDLFSYTLRGMGIKACKLALESIKGCDELKCRLIEKAMTEVTLTIDYYGSFIDMIITHEGDMRHLMQPFLKKVSEEEPSLVETIFMAFDCHLNVHQEDYDKPLGQVLEPSLE